MTVNREPLTSGQGGTRKLLNETGHTAAAGNPQTEDHMIVKARGGQTDPRHRRHPLGARVRSTPGS